MVAMGAHAGAEVGAQAGAEVGRSRLPGPLSGPDAHEGNSHTNKTGGAGAMVHEIVQAQVASVGLSVVKPNVAAHRELKRVA